jgi:dUTP pyrophosphatase
MDLVAALDENQTVVLHPGDRFLIPTGLAMAIPEGFEGQVRPRSGLALKHGITVLNAPGTIDSDYRNEVKVLLMNHGQAPFEIKRGDRIAQLLIAPVPECEWLHSSAEDLGDTQRGLGGYGSTGV